MKIGIGCDPAGFTLKQYILEKYADSYSIEDKGCFSLEPADYTTYAEAVAIGVASGEFERGILICGTGHGMTIAANRYKGIRAVHCSSALSAVMSREHNDSNILCFGGWVVRPDEVQHILDAWLFGKFSGGVVHKRRIEQLDSIST